MPTFSPTTEQRTIANAVSTNARLLGSANTVDRLLAAASSRFNAQRIGELIAHVAARQSEFGRALVTEFRAGRFSAATAVLRPLLEVTVWIAWPFSASSEDRQKRRLIQLLLQQYRDARSLGVDLPADVVNLLAETTGKAARNPPDFQQMLKDADELERKTGGTEYWQSHYANWEWASRHVHPSLFGSYLGPAAAVENERVGINAIVWGHQYLAMAGVTCAIAADLDDLGSVATASVCSICSGVKIGERLRRTEEYGRKVLPLRDIRC
jgi:hypothetical protein